MGFWLVVIGSLIFFTKVRLVTWRWQRPPSPPKPKLPFWDYVILAILALFVLHWMKEGVEADPLKCNRLNAKPPLAGLLTCQKTYRYQPDPFTG